MLQGLNVTSQEEAIAEVSQNPNEVPGAEQILIARIMARVSLFYQFVFCFD